MTYKLVIADDEYFIRQRLIKIIQESAPEVEIAGEAENGREVLELLELYPVDLVLLDIKMPRMTGLEVSEHIRIYYPHIKIIILSGYNEFEFARKALQAGVVDYLLKPICPQTLLDTVSCCIEKIKADQANRKKMLKYTLEDKRSAVNAYLKKELSEPDFLNLYPEFKQITLCFYTGLYMSALSAHPVEELIGQLEKMGCNFIYIQETDHTFLLRFFAADQEAAQLAHCSINHVLSDRKDILFYRIGETFSFQEYKTPEYHTIKNVLLLRFFPPAQAPAEVMEISSAQLMKIRQDLTAQLNTQNTDAIRTYISGLFDFIALTGHPQNLYAITMEILLTLQFYFSYSSDIRDLVNTTLDEEYTLDGLKETILTACFQSMEKPEYSPSEYYASNKVADYIRQNYNRELSVADIADIWKLNPSYLSAMFKKIYKVSIHQYITQIRMERARALLLTHNYKISEVAEMTGYADIFYFSKRFKKYFGQSPKDFQNAN